MPHPSPVRRLPAALDLSLSGEVSMPESDAWPTHRQEGDDSGSGSCTAAIPPPTPLQLFLGFMRIAAFSFGGVLPWARYVLVERRRWLEPQEFTDMLAVCQLLPGPNIVNMSVAIGARFHGWVGALASVLGLMGLPTVIVLTLATVYDRVQDVPSVSRALAAMAAAAAGLIVTMAVKMAEPMLRRRFWVAAPFIALTFVAVALFRFPLLAVVLAIGPLAVATALWAR